RRMDGSRSHLGRLGAPALDAAVCQGASLGGGAMNSDASADPSVPQFSDGPDVYRPWLNLLARLQIDSLFLGKFDASDTVRQSLSEAHRCRAQFRGTAAQQYRAWLRGILLTVVRHEVRRYRGVEARRIDREAIQRSAQES